MKKRTKIVLFLIIITSLHISFVANSQVDVIINKDEFKKNDEGFSYAWSNIKIADKFYIEKTESTYLLAVEYYTEAYNYNSENAELNYKIGVSILNSVLNANSLTYLEKAYQTKPTVASDINFQLARAYHFNYKFNEAIQFYNLYKEALSSTEKLKMTPIIDKYIEECTNGKALFNKPIKVEITNISTINGTFPDYSPVISADESMLIFTSRRDETLGGGTDKNDGQYYEDIYVSYNIDGNWKPAENIGRPLNTKTHDATVGLAPDGQSMLIYRDMDLYICYLKGENWTEPELLPETINTDEVENSACFSYDGNSIYFIRGKTSNPNTSNGDIYVSKKNNNGDWAESIKLSTVINTKYDEDGVFMHPDGRTLYFSSRGHNTMGEYDIFSSTLQEDESWSTPINLGYPVNSPDNDIYFVLSADAKHGYYSSVKEDALGFSDIYLISFFKEKTIIDTLIAEITDTINEVATIQTVRLTLVKGIIYDAISLKPIEATIEIYDNELNEKVSTQISNSKTGKYLVSLPSGKNYGLVVKADNYLFHSENFDIDDSETFTETIKDILLVSVEEGSKVVLKNIFFDVNKSILRSESFPELERLKLFLNEYPDLNIELSGHTDNTGSYLLNKELSENRAKAVVDYLIENGISSSRLKYRGASFDEPIATNDTEEGKQLNRRVEFKIVQ